MASAAESVMVMIHDVATKVPSSEAGGRVWSGTSTMVFGNFPVPIAGKTGTAQKDPSTDQRDQSWWCGDVPAESTTPPELVVCALIENGGFGADAAAPAALQVFKQYFNDQLGASNGVTAR